MPRGRTSAAAATVIPLGPGMKRPEPPEEFSEFEAFHWHRIVDAMAPEWFDGGCIHLLVDLCVLIAGNEQLRAGYFKRGEWTNSRAGTAYRETAVLIMNLSTKLRLTPQSRYDRFRAATRHRGTAHSQKAWQLDDDEDAA